MATNPQKYLKILSIILIVFAVLTIVIGIAATVFGGMSAITGAYILEEVGEYTNEATMMAGAGVIAVMFGVMFALGALFDLALGILGLGVAKDGRRMKGFFILCYIGIALNIFSIVMGLIDGYFAYTSLICLAVEALALYLGKNVQKELQK